MGSLLGSRLSKGSVVGTGGRGTPELIFWLMCVCVGVALD